ncbi:MAG: hypothetical protein K0S81_1906 [Rhodospirillales bacterium]|nr:hypothetical protein [Rhodospirillales bacterium]
MAGVNTTVSVPIGGTTRIVDQVAGLGGLTKTGDGSLWLVANNAYQGGTALNGGTVRVTSDAKLGAASGGLSFNGGTLQIAGTAYTMTGRTIAWGAAGGGIDVEDSAATFTLNQSLGAGGALVKTGAGTLVLNGANMQNGLTIGGGTVAASSDAELGVGDLVFDSGTLRADATFATENNATLLAGGGIIDTQSNNLTMSGVISGAGRLTKDGTGILLLSGANTYSGGTTVSDGILWGDSTGIQGNVVNHAAVVFAQGGDGTYTGQMSGTGTVSKTGGGKLSLTGTNSHTGPTVLFSGILSVSSDANLGATGSTGSLLIFNGGDFDITGSCFTSLNRRVQWGAFAGAINIADAGNSFTLDQDLTGTGALTKLGAGTLILGGTNNMGALNINDGTVAVSSDANLGSGTITLDGATLRSDADFAIDNAFVLGSSGIFDTNGHILILDGEISGTGPLVKSGAGTLVLNGANSFAGGTTVTQGTLQVDGSVDGPAVILKSGTVLTCTGIISGQVSGAGTLRSDAVSPLTVAFYNASGGTFDARIGSSPALNVTNSASLAGGSIFIDTANVDDTLALGASFVAIETGDGIAGDFASLTDGSAFFIFSGMVSGTQYIVTVTGQEQTFTDVALTDNQMEVADALEYLGGEPEDPDLAEVVNEINKLDEDGARDAFDALAGEINADMPTAPLANAQLFQGSLFQRLGTLGGGNGQSAFSLGQLALDEAGATPEVSVAAAMAGATGPAATGVWVRAHGLFGEVDGDEDGTGAHDLDHSTAGLMAGYDWALSETTVVGLGAGSAHSDLDLDAVEQEGEIHSYRLAAYGGTRMGALSVRGLVGYAYHDNETERQITTGGFDQTAEGDYAGHELSAAAEVGYLMQLGALGLEPVAGLAVTHLSDESYEESGAGGAGLEVDGRSTTSLRSTLGARASFAPSPAFRLSASLAWAHELADTEREVDASFLGGGGTFRIQGAEVSRNSALVGVALGVALGAGVDLTLGYDGQFGADDTAHGAEARLKIGL